MKLTHLLAQWKPALRAVQSVCQVRRPGLWVMAVLLGFVGTASAQTYAGSHELNNCAIPTRVLFSNSAIALPGLYGIKRHVQYPGGALTEMQPQPGYRTGKNWQMNQAYGPVQVQNCSNGGPWGTQWLSFRLKTTNFISSGIIDHLVFGVRFYMSPVATVPKYDGIGMALLPAYGGMMGERFRLGYGEPNSELLYPSPARQVPLQDGVEYAVNIHATASYTSLQFTNVATGQSTGFVGYANPSQFPPVNNTGLIFAVLCSGPVEAKANCENWNHTQWSVDLWSITSGWY
ncbi:MAG TPA: hypothetical protein VF815_16970 [Myxococcaceae bacterium]